MKSTFKKITLKAVSFVCLIAIAVAGLALSGCGKDDKGNDSNTAVIDVKDYGKIVVELDPKSAPITVENFKKLVKQGFYDGLTFHRVIEGFMIQGGDPNGDGTGGTKETIKGEFSENGVDNKLSHTKGAISMARTQDPNGASSQFFICQADCKYLDGKYAVFGYVTSGLEVVDAIAKNTPSTGNNGAVEKSKQPVINSIKLQ